MDMGPICHVVYKSMKFIKKRLNRENFYSFKLDFSNFVANWPYKGYGKIQNFSSISLKLCLLDQKNTGTWTVNITIDLHRSVLRPVHTRRLCRAQLVVCNMSHRVDGEIV